MTVSGVNSDYYYEEKTREPKKTVDQDMFLQLMIAQMKNQNPLEPQSNEEFISQLTQFSMLEQITNLNNKISQLVLSHQLNQGLMLIGATATFVDGEGNLVTGVVERLSILNNEVYLTVGNKRYSLDQLVMIEIPQQVEDPDPPDEQEDVGDIENEEGNDEQQDTTEPSDVDDSGEGTP